MREERKCVSCKGGRFPRHGRWGAAIFVVSLLVQSSASASPGKSLREASDSLTRLEKAEKSFRARPVRPNQTQAGELVAQAELHVRTGQVDHAIDLLNQIVELHNEGKASASDAADARFMLGEAYLQTEQLNSARRQFLEITEHSQQNAYAMWSGKAASRLVDIALRSQHIEELDELLKHVNSMLARTPSEALFYAKAKTLFAQKKWDVAYEQSERLVKSKEFAQRVAYLRGTILMRKAQSGAASETPDFRGAIAEFQRAATSPLLKMQDAESRTVSELSWLAVARLFYEMKDFGRAALAYQKISRSSELFPEALFELAWTYIHLDDFERGERALAALSVLDPDLMDGADAILLRGDLYLRMGAFEDARQIYQGVIDKYGPLRTQLDEYLKANQKPEAYYNQLILPEYEASAELPALTIRWARDEAKKERVFFVVDDLARSQQILERSLRVIRLLEAGLQSSSRIKLFSGAEQQKVQLLGLLNQIAIVRRKLADGLDQSSGANSGALSKVRAERRQMMAAVVKLPTARGDFSVRLAQVETPWNRVGQDLQKMQQEIDHGRALINGLRTIVADTRRFSATPQGKDVSRYHSRIVEMEQELVAQNERIEQLRMELEAGRMQAGLGDEGFEKDASLRERFAVVFDQELALAASSSDKKQSDYAKQALPQLRKLQTLEASLKAKLAYLEKDVKLHADEMQKRLRQEASAVEEEAAQLKAVELSAQDVLGEVTRRSFEAVSRRLKQLVIRADIGLVQQAWEFREHQKEKVGALLRERSYEDHAIDEEMADVLDVERLQP